MRTYESQTEGLRLHRGFVVFLHHGFNKHFVGNVFRERHHGALRIQIDIGTLDTRHLFKRLFHVGHATGTHHSLDMQRLFHEILLLVVFTAPIVLTTA